MQHITGIRINAGLSLPSLTACVAGSLGVRKAPFQCFIEAYPLLVAPFVPMLAESAFGGKLAQYAFDPNMVSVTI